MNSNVGLLVCTHRVQCFSQRLLLYIYVAYYMPILCTIIYNVYGKKLLNRLLIFLCGGGSGLLNVTRVWKAFFLFLFIIFTAGRNII